MKNKRLFSFGIALALLLLSSSPASARVHTCEEWKEILPPKYAQDIRLTEEEASTGGSVLRSCGAAVGRYALSYAKWYGKNTLIMELAAQVGISGASVSFVMVTGYQALAAWNAAKFVYRAFEADKRCYYNHELKRGMVEPIAHFYPESHLNTMVKNYSCSQLGSMVYSKMKSLDAGIAQKAYKQREYEQRTSARRKLSEAALRVLERAYPAELRTLSENERIYVYKREAMRKPLPVLTVASDLMSCLKPEAMARMACGLVAEVGIRYARKGGASNNAFLDAELRRLLFRIAAKLPTDSAEERD